MDYFLFINALVGKCGQKFDNTLSFTYDGSIDVNQKIYERFGVNLLVVRIC